MKTFVDKVVLLTGASGGIGSALVDVLVDRGVRKIYATDLKMSTLLPLQTKYPKVVVPMQLDITNLEAVKACHQSCGDIHILINNAGVEFATRFIGDKSIQTANLEMNVNYHGTHNMCATFFASLLNKPSSCIVNMLSVASFTLIPQLATYCASKAAAHTLTESLRKECEGTSLEIYGVYPGYVDTQMTKNIVEVEKVTPEQIAVETCNGIEQGIFQIFPDKMAKLYGGKINELNRHDEDLQGTPSESSTSPRSMFSPTKAPKPVQAVPEHIKKNGLSHL